MGNFIFTCTNIEDEIFDSLSEHERLNILFNYLGYSNFKVGNNLLTFKNN